MCLIPRVGRKRVAPVSSNFLELFPEAQSLLLLTDGRWKVLTEHLNLLLPSWPAPLSPTGDTELWTPPKGSICRRPGPNVPIRGHSGVRVARCPGLKRHFRRGPALLLHATPTHLPCPYWDFSQRGSRFFFNLKKCFFPFAFLKY